MDAILLQLGPRRAGARARRLFASPTTYLVAALVLAAAALLVSFGDLELQRRLFSAAASLSEEGRIHDLLLFIRPFGKGGILAAIGLLAGALGWRRTAVRIVVAMLICGALVTPTKFLVGRYRPGGGDRMSFPSGDAAAIAALAVPLVAWAPRLAPGAGALALAVAATRVIDGKHYPSDVLAGLAVGLLAGWAALLLPWPRRVRARRLTFLLATALILLGERFWEGPSPGSHPSCRVFLAILGPALALAVLAMYARPWARRARCAFQDPAYGRRWAGTALAALGGAVLACYLLAAGSSTLWDRDEPRFATATVEMVRSGQYLFPTFNGALRAHKPILIYWLMSLPVRWLGPIDLACRSFAPLASVAAGLLTAAIGVRFCGAAAAGPLAMAALAATPLMMVSGTAATTDAVLLAFITAAMWSLAVSWRSGLSTRWTAILGLSLGAALLTKGPVGLAIPVLSVLAGAAWARGFPASAGRYVAGLVLAVVTGTLFFLAWGIPANLATHGEFLRQGLGHHVLERSVTPMEHHGGNYFLSLPYYLPIVLFAFFPWTLFLPGALSALAGGRSVRPPHDSFLWGWIVATPALMTLVATKLPHYVLPAWPALAIAVAAAIGAHQRRELAERDLKWMDRGRWLFGPVGLLLGLGFVLAPWFLPIPGARGPCVGAGILMLTLTAVALREHQRRHFLTAAAVLAVGLLLFQTTLAATVLPAFEHFKVSPQIARAIRAAAGPEVPVATRDYSEPSLNFYLGGPPIRSLSSDDEVAEWAQLPGPGVLVIPRPALERIERDLGPLDLRLIASAQGYNYSRGRWVDLMALEKQTKFHLRPNAL